MNEINLEEIRAELASIEISEIPEHQACNEPLHGKLVDALKSIEEL